MSRDHLSVLTVAILRLLYMYSARHYIIHQWRQTRIVWMDQISALFAIDALDTAIKYMAHNLTVMCGHDRQIMDHNRMSFHMLRLKKWVATDSNFMNMCHLLPKWWHVNSTRQVVTDVINKQHHVGIRLCLHAGSVCKAIGLFDALG